MSRARAVDRPRAAHATHPPSSLPVRLTSFVGRAHETAYLIDLVERERSVTLVGAPGVGKTSLAVQVASGLNDSYADGVWFVELAGLADPALTPDAVAAALGVQEEPGRLVMATLAEHVTSRELLLVLDNCEHLILACATLVETLLRAGPGVRVLATSREPLRNDGEVSWRVPSLSVPGPGNVALDVTAVHEYEAVQLFASRARAALASFALSPEIGRSVAEICRRLDGIPLAIELAAARAGALSVEEIAARLDDRLALSNAGRRTAIPRQQTLRGAIDWSFELLSKEERMLLRRLAVFAGGWTLPAAEAVCGEPGDPTTVDLLVRLVERSLVQMEAGSGPEQRYRLLEMIRQYGLEQLQAAGEEATIRRRHLAWFSDLAERGQEGIHGPDGALWLDRLAADLDNLRAVLTCSVTDPESASGQAGLRMVGALYQFWFFRDHVVEGRRWTEAVLATNPAPDGETWHGVPPRRGAFGAHPRVVALLGLGGLWQQLGENERALASTEEALTLARAIGDRHGIAHAFLSLANMYHWTRQHERAAALNEEGVQIFRRLGDTFGLWRGLTSFGETLIQSGDFDRAGPVLEESLAAGRAIGHPWGVAQVLRQLSVVAFWQGNLDRAAQLAEEARAGWARLGATRGLNLALIDLGHVALARHDARGAARMFSESLALSRGQPDRRNVARCLIGLIAAATGVGGHETKAGTVDLARLLGSVKSVLEASGYTAPAHERTVLAETLNAVRGGLDEKSFEAAWKEGERLSVDQVIERGLELARQIEAATAPAPGAAQESSPRQSPALILTQREREIAVLVGRGYTNRRIAQELTIAEKTAEVHARNIREKLGLSTRAQIAARVAQQGLLGDAT